MAVQDAKAPGRQHQQAQAPGGDPQEVDCQVEAPTLEARCQQDGQRSGRQDGDHDESTGQGGEQPGHGAGHPARLVVTALAE